jgi:hypothetical protein
MDESGHDHKHMPYEVRGGVAIHAGKLWPMVQQLQQVELAAFGARLHEFKKEIKGSRLLDKDRFKWAAQSDRMEDEVRRKHCRGFLTKGLEKKPPRRDEFTAYGQACLEMARGIFQALRAYEARLFASVIPASVVKPVTFEAEEYLRKDHVFLLQRFFYFLEAEKQHGVLVFDQVDKGSDLRFVRRMERYFSRTSTGRYRSAWIVPVPLFVASDMSYAIQQADLCIYSLNWGFRLPALDMNAPTRAEIASEFGPWINQLQYRGHGYRDGNVYNSYGIVYVPDPYDGRE